MEKLPAIQKAETRALMEKHTYKFIENYKGIGAFGWDRKSDEETVKFYLQKFAEDSFMDLLIEKLSDPELEEIYSGINKLLRNHLTETQYHRHFLKDGTH